MMYGLMIAGGCVRRMVPESTLSNHPPNLRPITDTGNCRVRFVSGATIRTVVGVGVCDFAGDGRQLAETHIDAPVGVAASPSGNLFISESGGRVRLVAQGSMVTTSAVFAAAQPALQSPSGLAVSREDDETLVIADAAANRLLALSFAPVADQRVFYAGLSTLAGTGLAGDAVDGPGNATALRELVGLENAYFTFRDRTQSFLVFSDAGEI